MVPGGRVPGLGDVPVGDDMVGKCHCCSRVGRLHARHLDKACYVRNKRHGTLDLYDPQRAPVTDVIDCPRCGQVAARGSRGLCARCYKQVRVTDELYDWAPLVHRREDVLEDWALLRSADPTITVPQAAARIGIGHHALIAHLLRARAAGDERAVFTFAGMSAARRPR